jgi:2-amino-4-hydroxy-6-hydroxymethyldihydropteridine diphosphokinase
MVTQALAELRALPDVIGFSASGLYRTAPVGLLRQPDFINAVAALEFADNAVPSAPTLLAHLFAIEARFGRQRSVRNAPRTLDLDLLLLGDETCADPACTLPHPRLHQRAFVLQPLADLAPNLVIPGHGPLPALLQTCRDQHIERLSLTAA